jgi:glycosyltransferase involved in cell wall biosynthesis
MPEITLLQKLPYSVAITACARDCASALAQNITRIERLREYFASSVVIIVENDSIDGTKKLLAKWEATSPDVVILSKDTHELTIPKKSREMPHPASTSYRLERMCRFRNTYMDWVQTNRPTIDLLLVIDIDIDDFLPESVVWAITTAPDDWAALFSNGVKYLDFFRKKVPSKYYDDSAYLPFFEKKELYVDLTLSEIKYNRDMISRELKNTLFLKCSSAFGGIGIYRYQYVKDAQYVTQLNTRDLFAESICEHILFNVKLRKYGTCYIARDLFIYHTRLKKFNEVFIELLPTALWLFLYRNFRSRRRLPTVKKILINGDFLCRKITGVERYAYEITQRLDKLSKSAEIAIIIPANTPVVPAYKNLEIIRHKKKTKSHVWWQMATLQYFLLLHRNYIPLEFGNTCLPLAPGIVFLHDIYCEFFPEDFVGLRDKIARFYNRWQYRLIARKAKQIGTVSYFSKKQITETYHIDPGKITVIYNGWEHFRSIQADYSVFEEFPVLSNPANPFYFSLGSLSKRKNIKWIYEYASEHPDTLFAISGESLPTTKLTMTDMPVALSNILFLGYLSDEKVKALMEKCKAFIMPSYYEGFGIPPLEALSCGAKIIVAQSSSLPEIYGETAHYIDPFTTDVNLDTLLQEPVESPDAILAKYSYDTAAAQLYKMIDLTL